VYTLRGFKRINIRREAGNHYISSTGWIARH
jgi:hypothetical protein